MILVTGATGNIGRELTRELDAKGATLRLLVRDPARAARLPERAERVVGDLGDPATLAPAFDGVDQLFLLTQGIGTHYTAAAEAAGVHHIVHLSSFHVTFDPIPAMGRWHHEREKIIRASGMAATFLRPGGFMTNALDWLPTIREGGAEGAFSGVMHQFGSPCSCSSSSSCTCTWETRATVDCARGGRFVGDVMLPAAGRWMMGGRDPG